MIRQLAMAAAALATAALVIHPTAGMAAQSSKPKEIVVVGSKGKAKPTKVDAPGTKQKSTKPSGVKSYHLQDAWPSK